MSRLMCYGGCGLAYEDFPLDVLISDPLWQQIAPKPDGGGVLCPNCITAGLARLPEVTVAYMYITDEAERRWKEQSTVELRDRIAKLEAENAKLRAIERALIEFQSNYEDPCPSAEEALAQCNVERNQKKAMEQHIKDLLKLAEAIAVTILANRKPKQ